MFRTIEATIDEKGNVELSEAVSLTKRSRALLTILDDGQPEMPLSLEAALLSEKSLARYWSLPQEDEAWAHLKDLPAIEDDAE